MQVCFYCLGTSLGTMWMQKGWGWTGGNDTHGLIKALCCYAGRDTWSWWRTVGSAHLWEGEMCWWLPLPWQKPGKGQRAPINLQSSTWEAELARGIGPQGLWQKVALVCLEEGVCGLCFLEESLEGPSALLLLPQGSCSQEGADNDYFLLRVNIFEA